MAKVVTVLAKLVSATPDRTQYKPYAPVLEFDNVYVEIPIPAEQADVQKGDKIVLTVDGLATTLDVVASAIEKMNTAYTQSKQNPYANRKPY
jgi:hypothetical protein